MSKASRKPHILCFFPKADRTTSATVKPRLDRRLGIPNPGSPSVTLSPSCATDFGCQIISRSQPTMRP
jgi:hypothetical protein